MHVYVYNFYENIKHWVSGISGNTHSLKFLNLIWFCWVTPTLNIKDAYVWITWCDWADKHERLCLGAADWRIYTSENYALMQIMACFLFSTKPITEPTLQLWLSVDCTRENAFKLSLNKKNYFHTGNLFESVVCKVCEAWWKYIYVSDKKPMTAISACCGLWSKREVCEQIEARVRSLAFTKRHYQKHFPERKWWYLDSNFPDFFYQGLSNNKSTFRMIPQKIHTSRCFL